jgi:hypothetical protein
LGINLSYDNSEAVLCQVKIQGNTHFRRVFLFFSVSEPGRASSPLQFHIRQVFDIDPEVKTFLDSGGNPVQIGLETMEVAAEGKAV